MNDQAFADELTARLDEAAATADVRLPADVAADRRSARSGATQSGIRRLADTNRRLDHQGDTRRWASIAAAALIVVGGVVAILVTRSGSNPASTSTVATTVSPSTAPVSTAPVSTAPGSTPASTTPGSTVATTATTPASDGPIPTAPSGAVALTRTIVPGDQGDDVGAIQRRLTELGYQPGAVDGVYGSQTVSAVWAFKTLVGGQSLDAVTDEVTPELWELMNQGAAVVPRRPGVGGTHVEIYLPEQAMVVFDGDDPALIAHISSGALDTAGNPVEFCLENVVKSVDREAPVAGTMCGETRTPAGVFEVGEAPQEPEWGQVFGEMLDPVFFNYIIAIHGAAEVPLRPASRGGVQVDARISPIVRSLLSPGDKVLVWNGNQQPEDISRSDSMPSIYTFNPNESSEGRVDRPWE